jgi:hypothetical protein
MKLSSISFLYAVLYSLIGYGYFYYTWNELGNQEEGLYYAKYIASYWNFDKTMTCMWVVIGLLNFIERARLYAWHKKINGIYYVSLILGSIAALLFTMRLVYHFAIDWINYWVGYAVVIGFIGFLGCIIGEIIMRLWGNDDFE